MRLHHGFALAPFLLCGFASPAHAQTDTYSCVTRDGRTVSGSFPPRECDGLPIRRTLPNGRVELIEPPTAEQRRRDEAEKKRQQEEREKRQRQMRKDFALLDRYKSEAEIHAAHDRDLAALKARIVAAQKLLPEIERERVKLAEETKFYEKRELPPGLKKSIEANATRRATQEKIVNDAQEAMRRVNSERDTEVTRWRELTAAARPVPAK